MKEQSYIIRVTVLTDKPGTRVQDIIKHGIIKALHISEPAAVSVEYAPIKSCPECWEIMSPIDLNYCCDNCHVTLRNVDI